jgi:hypothetical protein
MTTKCSSHISGGLFAPRTCLILLCAAHAASAAGILVRLSGAPLPAAAVAAGQAFVAALPVVNRLITPCDHCQRG